jgi:hypothetical protein
MAFKKVTGFVGSKPNNFIHTKLPVCPMCGQETGWEIDQKIGMLNSLYFFRCEKCLAVLSTPVNDIAKINTTVMLVKKMSGKKALTPYFKVVDVGNMQTTQLHKDREYELSELLTIADNNANLK